MYAYNKRENNVPVDQSFSHSKKVIDIEEVIYISILFMYCGLYN